MNRKKEGFTLIEVVISLAILSVSIVVILQLFSGGLRSIKVSDDYIRAAVLAQNKMNRLESKFNFLEEDEGVFDEDDRYHWSLTVEDYELAELLPQFENLKVDNENSEIPILVDKITLKVFWDIGDKQRTFELVTLKTGTSVDQASARVLQGNYPPSLFASRGNQFGEQNVPGGQSAIEHVTLNLCGKKMTIERAVISGNRLYKKKGNISGN